MQTSYLIVVPQPTLAVDGTSQPHMDVSPAVLALTPLGP